MTSQTPRNIFLKESIMATQTRRTTRRSAKFFRTTVKASMVTACCGLILWSAVAAHAAVTWNGMPRQGLILNGTPLNGIPWNGIGPNGIPFNGVPIQGMPYNGMPFQGLLLNGTPYNGYPIQGMPIQGMPMNGTPLQGRPANEGSVPPVQSESLPWSTLSQQPLGQSTR
jgi:hypothetical protein